MYKYYFKVNESSLFKNDIEHRFCYSSKIKNIPTLTGKFCKIQQYFKNLIPRLEIKHTVKNVLGVTGYVILFMILLLNFLSLILLLQVNLL